MFTHKSRSGCVVANYQEKSCYRPLNPQLLPSDDVNKLDLTILEIRLYIVCMDELYNAVSEGIKN